MLTLSIMVTALIVNGFAGGKYSTPSKAKITSIPPLPPVIVPNPLYIGIGAVVSTVKRDPCPCDPNDDRLTDTRYGAVARVGADYNQYLGLEGRFFKTFGSDAFSTVQHYGLYIKPQYHFIDEMNIYGLLGYGKTTIDYTNGIISRTTAKSGLAYGIGLEYDIFKEKKAGRYLRHFDNQGDQEKGFGVWMDFQHLLHKVGKYNSNSNIGTVGITYDF